MVTPAPPGDETAGCARFGGIPRTEARRPTEPIRTTPERVAAVVGMFDTAIEHEAAPGSVDPPTPECPLFLD